MKKSQHKMPPRNVIEDRIRQEVTQQYQDKAEAEFRRGYGLAADDARHLWTGTVKDLEAENTQLKQQLLKQSQPIQAVLWSFDEHSGWLVRNWKSGWKWISNWSLAGIAYVSIYGVPAEVIELLPVATQSKVTAGLAVIGLVGRFINQSKSKPLPTAEALNDNSA